MYETAKTHIATGHPKSNRLYEDLKDTLPPSMLARPNSKYSTKEIVEYVLMMCSKGVSHLWITVIMNDQDDVRNVPTDACLLKRMGGSPYKETYEHCDRMLDATLNEPRMRMMLRKPVVTATDEHDIPTRFKKVDEEFMTTGRPKGGTGKKIRYTAVKVVGGPSGFTVGIHPTGKRYGRAEAARLMVERFRAAGITSKMHLMGYFCIVAWRSHNPACLHDECAFHHAIMQKHLPGCHEPSG